MPPQRPCIKCRKLTRNPSRCDTCQAIYQAHEDAQRAEAEPWRRVYKMAEWEKAQQACFERDGHQCRARLADGTRCPKMTTLQAHHEPMLRELWWRNLNPFDLEYLYTLCNLHHARADAYLRQRSTA